MITAQLSGGLGNQLFQVSAAVSLARQYSDEASFNFDNWQQSTQGHSPYCYRNTIFRNLLQTDQVDWQIYKEPDFKYKEIPYQANLKIRGLFQSEKYFHDSKEFLLSLFSSPILLLAKLQVNYAKILHSLNCAVHVRRGDYLKTPKYYKAFDLDYYHRAIKLFPDHQFLIFSDDIDYCKQVFIGTQFSFIEGNSDDEDLYLMSLCGAHIIANSTFSWWGAYLSVNSSKVIVPKTWFGSGLKHIITDDIYTLSMIKV